MADRSSFIEQWNEAKMKISDLERKCERYKRLADKIMDHSGTNEIKYADITVKRKDINRSTIARKDVPKDVWERYSKRTSYVAYYMSEKL
jgi:hypothetical protein